MDWLATLFTGGANILSGGLIGAIGGVISGWMKLKERTADQEHERLMRDKDKEMLLAEADSAVKLEGARAITAIEQGAADAFTASQVNARVEIPEGISAKAAPWVCTLFVFGEFAKGMVRVVITLVAFGAVAALAGYGLFGVADAVMKGQMALAAVKSLIFVSEMSTGWWFAHRQMTK